MELNLSTEELVLLRKATRALEAELRTRHYSAPEMGYDKDAELLRMLRLKVTDAAKREE